MIRILRHGNNQYLRIYKVTCQACGCVFEFNEYDTNKVEDYDNYQTINCPECNKLIYEIAFMQVGGFR